MAKLLVLQDFVSVQRTLSAGDVVDDATEALAPLYAAGLTTMAYVDAMEPYVVAWRSQTRANEVRPSLGVLLLTAGFFFGAGSGDVVGPAGAVPNSVMVADGPTGKMIKGTLVGIDGSGNITTPGTVDGRNVSVDGATLDAVDANLTAHVADTANPHATTAAQVGAVAASRAVNTTAPLGGGGTLVADLTLTISAATTLAAGTMSAADKAKLDGLPSSAPPVARAINTTAPLVGGGDLSADRTIAATFAAPAQGIGGGNTEGAAVSFARSDHDHTVRETGGPTNLTVGAIADGQLVQRSGTVLIGVTASASSTPNLGFGAGSVAATTTTRYLVPGYDTGVAPTSAVPIPMTRSATIRRLFVNHGTPAGNGSAIVYTVRKNGVPQALTVSLASTGSNGNDVANSFAVVAGDVLDIEVTKAASVGTSPSDVVANFEVV